MSAAELKPAPDEELWTVEEVRKYLKRSVSWVYKKTEDGTLPKAPGFAWGNRYIPEAIRAWAAGNVIPIGRRR